MTERLARWLVTSSRGRLQRGGGVLLPGPCFDAIMERQQGFAPWCTLSFDCDFPRDIEVLPQLVSLLERFGHTASFACVGQWIRRFAEAHRTLVAAGHELLNHTDTHPNLYHPGYPYARHEGLSRKRFNQIPPCERREEIERCHRTCVEVLGYAPVGFRTPHFGALHLDGVYPALAELGYRFSTSTLATAAPGNGLPHQHPCGVWEIPLSPCPAHPFGVFDSWHSLGKRRAAHAERGELAALFGRLGDRVLSGGGLVNAYFDPKDVLESGEMERILQVLKDRAIPVGSYQTLLGVLEPPQAESCPVGR